MQRSGVANLPLHDGRVPPWLADRMTKLGAGISEAIITQYGAAHFLSRLSDPFWFQALGAVMGMDWHSSGITTSVMGALKRGLAERSFELGIHICGGRGRHSRNTPRELQDISDHYGFDGDALVRTSRLTARIDNNAICDGYQIYLHSFVLASTGGWTVIQQGLNDKLGMARRYHWHSENIRNFTIEPHSAIVGIPRGEIMNLVAASAVPAQNALLQIVQNDPESTLSEIRRLDMPEHHDIRSENVDLKRLGAVLAVAYSRELHDFAELLLLEGLGPRTLQSLALIAEVVHGTPSRFRDPARFSFAHGGKDRHPFPVPLKTYDASIDFLRRTLDTAKMGDTERRDGMRRLNQFVKSVEERYEPEAELAATVTHEEAISPSLHGRCVFDDIPRGSPKQRKLF
jgi:hypothetical protein